MAQSFPNSQVKDKLSMMLEFIDFGSHARGAHLFEKGHVKSWRVNNETDTIELDVLSSASNKSYKVELTFNNLLKSTCSCPYNWGLCKHTAAAAYKLLQHVYNKNTPIFVLDQSNTVVEIPLLTAEWITNNTPPRLKGEVKRLEENAGFELQKIEQGKIVVKLQSGRHSYPVSFKVKKQDTSVITSCECKEGRFPLCKHKLAAFRYLHANKGDDALEQSLNWYYEKKAIIDDLGLSEEIVNKYSKLFKFYFENRDIFLKQTHGSLLLKHELDIIPQAKVIPEQVEPPVMDDFQELGLAYVLKFKYFDHPVPDLEVIPAFGKLIKNKDRIKSHFERIENPLENTVFLELAKSKDYEIIREAGKLYKVMAKIQYYDFHEDAYEYINMLRVLNILNPLLNRLSGSLTYIFEDDGLEMKLKGCQQVYISEDPMKAKIKQTSSELLQELHITYYQREKKHDLNPEDTVYFWLLKMGQTIYPWHNAGTLYLYSLTDTGHSGKLRFLNEHYNAVFERFVQFFHDKVEMELADANKELHQDVEPDKKIFIREQSGYIMFFPVLAYGEKEISAIHPSEGYLFHQKDEQVIKYERKPELETDFLSLFKNTHPAFDQQQQDNYYYLLPEQMLENNWFVDFYEQCKSNEIEVYGFKDLKSIKYYPAHPSVSYSIKSGEDWFDMEMKVDYDNHPVSLKDLRKAVINKEKMVPIGNGMYGMLPEDFVRKFETALKFGEIDEDKVSFQKSQFSIIHSLLDKQSDGQIAEELADKMQLLKSFNEITAINPPAKLNAELRDYQKAGLSWLAFLAKYNFGGCLADDMGLGKTVQMLAFFLHLKEQQPRKKYTHLVVCPTTLLFNWENEIAKFAPHLKREVHWGNTRNFDKKEWKKKDVILTTYGTMVNDIEQLNEFRFTTVVFDESQAMKNPSSLRFKAALLIQADYRFSLTGTPIENNTIELFSQMHVLNKGLLGNFNFFRKTYGKNMNGDGSKHLRAELRKMVYPFILRRTKEKVASELPEKSEMELYCEMGDHQQQVYDAFRAKYKNQLIGKIEEEGMNKARFNVLDGILKLRQICDSPSLVNTDEYYGDVSVKAEELIRHIMEKTTDHKVLVFSQFVKMLDLIRTRLENEGITYTSLDGSTRDRQERVEYFQNSDDCRVFLISLKAGGYGLNLTAADYVYLVDPWWNPAVETQAIDRTHRIGQDKKVFAYRMICKNTIEEKILNLQKRKKSLAEDIITEESSFVKNLTKKDIEHLFS